MTDMAEHNLMSYETIGWILKSSDEGFYLLIASREMQDIVVDNYAISGVAILDCLKIEDKTYSYRTISNWITEHPDKKAYFLKHFDVLLQNDNSIARLNFSRDMLADLEKNLIFCVTGFTDDKLNRKAIDFYSFIKLKIPFETENGFMEDDFEAVNHIKHQNLKPELTTDIVIDYSKSERVLLTKAISYMNVAKVEVQNNEYDNALNHLVAAYQIRLRLLGNRSCEIAEVYNRIGEVYEETGHYDEAKKYYEKALEIKELVLGTEHPSTAETYNGLAGVYKAKGDYGKALEYYGKALAISESVLGTEHPSTATTYNNMALVYKAQGDYEKALEYSGKALAISESVLGTEHPST
ncbi:MAG: tetratricopeptide repeat protein, partial [Lachnospiraceae bacterium]|nr:tetratricopeptide repeat protein [Lachnospiraceae bacterium]